MKQGRKALSTPIYTIGYGNRSIIEEFIPLLEKYTIQYLIDVRSVPYSKYNQVFSQKNPQDPSGEENIRGYLRKRGIRYVFMGKELGGRPESSACYTADGLTDYHKLAATTLYKEGIQRLHAAQPYRVCLMCSELRPQDCHRSKLIGETLYAEGIEVLHIDETGQLKTQQQVLGEFKQDNLELGGSDAPNPLYVSRKSYRHRE